MEKVCGIVVFLAVYQLAGMLDYHDSPKLTKPIVDDYCNRVSRMIGINNPC